MSDFSDLCSSYGLSPGDPEAIDKLIHLMHEDEDDEEDASWYFDNQSIHKFCCSSSSILFLDFSSSVFASENL